MGISLGCKKEGGTARWEKHSRLILLSVVNVTWARGANSERKLQERGEKRRFAAYSLPSLKVSSQTLFPYSAPLLLSSGSAQKEVRVQESLRLGERRLFRSRDQRREATFIGCASQNVSGGKWRRALPARREMEAGTARPLIYYDCCTGLAAAKAARQNIPWHRQRLLRGQKAAPGGYRSAWAEADMP